MDISQLERQLTAAKKRLKEILEAGLETEEMREFSTAFETVASSQRNLAAAKGEEYAVPHDIGFVPEAAVSEPVLLQADNAAILTFSARRPTAGEKGAEDGYGIVELDLCSLTKFGYPNDEALSGHPLAERGLAAYGIYEVHNSSWIRLKTEQNRVAFPNTPDSTQRHFVFTFHDNTFECIARGLHVSFSTKPYAQIFEEVRKRIFRTDG